ncbi:ATP-binding protein [Streptomyces sp. 7R007]
MLYGREAELRLLSDLVSRSRGGEGGALLLRGQAGIGKTSLLHAARAAAVEQGCRALSALGVQSEASVPFAGLHQLLNPVLQDHAVALAARQQEALAAAFGATDGVAPGMFSVGLAALELISALAEEAPLLLVVDDAHWIDAASSEVLAFVARRLEAERVLMLVAVREGHDTPLNDAGLPELEPARLDDQAARELLRDRAPHLDPSLHDRLLAEALGNPLALVELPAALGDDAGTQQTVLPWLPTTRRLERSFLSRATALPQPTRTVLLIAAADDEGDLAEILATARLVDGAAPSVASLEPAVDAGLIEIQGREVRFRHPLIRSAVYNAASPSRRLACHAALAEVLADQQERRARHRALATPGLDDEVALDLEAAATRALRRGAPRAAAEALRHAAHLSDPDTHRGRLLLRSAEIDFELGDAAAAREQLAEVKPESLRSGERLRLALWSEALNEESWYSPERVRTFAEVADRLADAESDGARLALRALWPLSISCWYGSPTQETRDIVVRTARRLQRRGGEAMVLSVAACADPVGEAACVIDAVGRLTPEEVGDPAEQHALGASLTAIWAYDLAWPYLCAAVDGLRRQSRLGLLGEALASQAWSALHLGKHRLARTAADEARRLSRDTGRPRWALVADLAIATLASDRGESDLAHEIIRETEAELLSVGAQSILGFAQFARGRYAMVNNQSNDAYEQLTRALDPHDIAYHPFVGHLGSADLIESAVRTGRGEAAQRHFAQLDALAEKTTAPYLKAMVTYARPLVAGDDTAEALYQQGLDSGLLTNWPFHRARLLLAYGRWLRRQRRLVDARRPLRSAVESFDALGIKAFAEDARAELRASGEAPGRPRPDTLDTLTPQELQIAKMAASGLTNREIGARLFISHRTVGQHLHRIFPKLGVTSRGQLHLADLGHD